MIPGKVKLGIAIPSGGDWKADFGISWGKLLCKVVTDPPAEEFALHFANRTGSMLPTNRTWLVKEMLKHGCTHILFLDDDMEFPEDIAHRLLAHGKAVVGANCSRKYAPYAPTAIGLDGKHCFTTDEKNGLEEVIHTGTAVMLLDARVFKGLEEPWFAMPYEPKRGLYVGEDVFFCHLLRSRGIKIFVDHAVSKDIGHIGNFSYTTNLAETIDKEG